MHRLDVVTNKFERGLAMKANLQMKVTVTDDANNNILEVDKLQEWGDLGADKDDVYCGIYNILTGVLYELVEASGHSIDYFL